MTNKAEQAKASEDWAALFPCQTVRGLCCCDCHRGAPDPEHKSFTGCNVVIQERIAQTLREVAEREYKRGVENAAKITERVWHTSGTDCDDRENCGIVVHNRYQSDAAAKLIRALGEQPK